MALRLKSEAAAMSEINVTPLVDVMLVLLVVFIVTAPLLTKAVNIALPKTSAAASAPQTRSVEVSMDAAGVMRIDQRAVSLPRLEDELRRLLEHDPQLTVRVYGDEHTAYGAMARMMAVIQRAGASNIALVTLPL